MITRKYYVKPNQPNVAVLWPGQPGSDIPGPENWGTPEKPVVFSAGAVSEWIYDPTSGNATDSTMEEVLHEIHFEPGLFWVGPDRDKSGKYIQGSTCIYLQNNPARPNRSTLVGLYGGGQTNTLLRYTPRNFTKDEVSTWGGAVEDAVIRSAPTSHLGEIQIHDMWIDANFNQQGYVAEEGSQTHGYKLHGIQVRGHVGQIGRVKITGSGSNSDTLGGSLANEAFPLNIYSLDTQAFSDGLQPWWIFECVIDGFTSVNGGYATMISVNPFTSIPEPMPVEYYKADGSNRTNKWCCIVEKCHVRGISGVNGIGASGTTNTDGSYASNYVLFRNNVVENCTLGCNFDTSGIRYIHVEDNVFVDVSAMAQLGTPTGGMVDGMPDPMNPTFHRNFYFARNIARLRRHDTQLSAAHDDRVHAAGLIIREGAAGIVCHDNTIIARDAKHFCDWDAPNSEKRYRLISPSSIDPYFPEYYGPGGGRIVCIDDWDEAERTQGCVCVGLEPGPTPFKRVDLT